MIICLTIPDVGHDKVTNNTGQDNSDILQPFGLDSKSGNCNNICTEVSLNDDDNVLDPARAYSVNVKKFYRFGRTLFRLLASIIDLTVLLRTSILSFQTTG